MSDNREIPVYKNPALPVEERVKDLVARMTLAEKTAQMLHEAPAIPRLDVPAYNWWNECLHGVARAGVATVFPQAIGLAATFNTELIQTAAEAISDEARAKHHEAVRQGDRGIYKGLTFWSPNINIFRDPRWGRGHETYGEDPYLTGRMGVAFIKGLQGNDPQYRKIDATAKHYAVHSGPEANRHSFNSVVSQKDLRETYLPAFKDCVQEAQVAAIMGAYNRTNGEPCCASKTLLDDILRQEWGFEGYVVSDCGAICDIYQYHKVVDTAPEGVALAVNNGCELNCGSAYQYLLTAVAAGLISEETIDRAVTRLFTSRFKLGMFDPEEQVPYASIPYEANDTDQHRELAYKTARESMVLLKNENTLLPLSKELKTIAVIGPNADERDVLLGNYNGIPSRYVTPLQGIRSKVEPGTKVYYTRGCNLTGDSTDGFSEAIAMAQRSDVVVLCLGLSPFIEGEEGDAYNSDASGDKPHLNLPGMQQKLLEAVHATGKPVILVLISGSALAVNWADEHILSVIQAWYPGAEGGTALADILFGDYNPSGRLPVTFMRTLEELPAFEDYSMKGRTYRYMEKEALYPFGYGLSYTHFEYSDLQLSSNTIEVGSDVGVTAKVTNTGERAGDEVAQLYIRDVEASTAVPHHQLIGFTRVYLQPGETKTIAFRIKARQMVCINEEGKCILEPGTFYLFAGGSQPDARSSGLTGAQVLHAAFEMIGQSTEIPY